MRSTKSMGRISAKKLATPKAMPRKQKQPHIGGALGKKKGIYQRNMPAHTHTEK